MPSRQDRKLADGVVLVFKRATHVAKQVCMSA
jgi:hypothetical protein